MADKPSPEPSPSVRLDKPVFFISLMVLIGVSALLLLDPEGSLERLQAGRRFVTHDLGWLFLGSVVVGLLWLIWMAFGRHGSRRFGLADSEPAYSHVSWMGMLFCAGIGSN